MKGRCPTCGKTYEVASLAMLPSFPFCGPRCRLVDLGRWIDGAYVLPGPEVPSPQGPSSDSVPDEDEDD